MKWELKGRDFGAVDDDVSWEAGAQEWAQDWRPAPLQPLCPGARPYPYRLANGAARRVTAGRVDFAPRLANQRPWRGSPAERPSPGAASLEAARPAECRRP